MARRLSHVVALPLAAGLSLAGPWSCCPSTSAEAQSDLSAGALGTQPHPPQHQRNLGHNGSSGKATASGAVHHQPASWPFALQATLQSVFVAHARGPAAGVSLKEAYHASLLQPLLSYMPDLGPRAAACMTPEALTELEAVALMGFDAANPLQVVSIAWTLAWVGHQPGQPYIEKLQAAAAAGSLPAGSKHHRLSAAHAAVLLWCAVMHGVATPDVWDAGLRAVAAAPPAVQSTLPSSSSAGPSGPALDECALLYLLHAAMLYAVDTTPPGARAATAAGSRTVSPTSPAAASATSPACQPRATREEVLAAAAPLGRKALAKLGQAYGEFVPLHPAIEGPYMALLFALVQLAAAAPAGRGGGAAAPADERWLPPGAAEGAAAVLANPKELARIKRDLQYHWRGDELVDPVQRVRNQVVYLLTRRMGLTVSQPEDVDVAAPSRWIAIYVRDSGGGGDHGRAVVRQTYGADGQPVHGPGGAGLSVVLADLEGLTDEALEVLMRERFAPVVWMPAYRSAGPGARQAQQQVGAGGVACSGPAGMWAARVRQLQRLGWRVVVVDVAAWRGLANDAEREAYLLRVVRGRGG